MTKAGGNAVPGPGICHERWSRVVDFSAYVLIGLTLVAAILLTAEYAPNAWWVDARIWKAAIATAVPFWYTLHLLRRRLRQPGLWLAWALMLTVHCCMYLYAVMHWGDWTTGTSLVVTIVEGTLVVGVLEWISRKKCRPERNAEVS